MDVEVINDFFSFEDCRIALKWLLTSIKATANPKIYDDDIRVKVYFRYFSKIRKTDARIIFSNLAGEYEYMPSAKTLAIRLGHIPDLTDDARKIKMNLRIAITENLPLDPEVQYVIDRMGFTKNEISRVDGLEYIAIDDIKLALVDFHKGVPPKPPVAQIEPPKINPEIEKLVQKCKPRDLKKCFLKIKEETENRNE